MKYAFSRLIFEKYSNIKFHENPSSGSRVVPCEWTDERTDGRTDGRTGGNRQADRWKNMAKLTVAFGDFVNAPKNEEMNVTGSGSFPYGKLYC